VILAELHDPPRRTRPGACRAYAAADGYAARWGGDRTLLRRPTRSWHRRAAAERGQRDGRCAVLHQPCRGGAPGKRERGRADRRGWLVAQSQCRSRWPHVRHGQSLGARPLPLQLSFRSCGDLPIPTRAMPRSSPVGSAFDLDPVDVTDADDARGSRLPVGRISGAGREGARSRDGAGGDGPYAAGQGDAVEVVPDACAVCPRTPCRSSSRRGRCRTSRSRAACAFLPTPRRSGGGRAGAWVSAEGVGVAPTIPTLAIAAPMVTASSA